VTDPGPRPRALLASVWWIVASGPVVGAVLAVSLRVQAIPILLASSGLGAVLAGLWGAGVTVRDEWRRDPVSGSRLAQVVGCFLLGLLLLLASGPRPTG